MLDSPYIVLIIAVLSLLLGVQLMFSERFAYFAFGVFYFFKHLRPCLSITFSLIGKMWGMSYPTHVKIERTVYTLTVGVPVGLWAMYCEAIKQAEAGRRV